MRKHFGLYSAALASLLIAVSPSSAASILGVGTNVSVGGGSGVNANANVGLGNDDGTSNVDAAIAVGGSSNTLANGSATIDLGLFGDNGSNASGSVVVGDAGTVGVNVGLGLGADPGGLAGAPGGPGDDGASGGGATGSAGGAMGRTLASNANCISPNSMQVLNAAATARYDTNTVRAWGQASSVRTVPVKFCAKARQEISRVIAGRPNMAWMQVAAARNAGISASLTGAHSDARHVLLVNQNAGQLSVYVY